MAQPPGGGQEQAAPFKPFILGRYNVLLPLGEGGMAEVYLAEQNGAAGFTRLVTIKRIKTNLGADAEFVRMFVDEARILVNIQHPNVVSVLDLQQEGPDLFMVLEYVNGGDLRHLLKALNAKGMVMPVQVAVFVAWSLMRGLVQAHEARGASGQSLDLIHRDVSPGNVLLGRNGAVKLSDFGVAKAVGRLAQTTDGAVKGSLSYMAPEMLELATCDQRADVFSAGVVLWEMLTCRRLFPGTQPTKLVEALLTKQIPPPSSVNPEVPAGLDAVVLRALARKPDARFQTARALEIALHAFIREHNPDELEGALASLVRDLVHVRDQEELAALPRPAPATPGEARLPDLSNVRLDETLGTKGPPPLSNSVDDFFVQGNAFNPAEVPALPKSGADDFFLAPPAIVETSPPAGSDAPTDDFFDVPAGAAAPAPPTAAPADDLDFSALGEDSFGAMLAQPLPAPTPRVPGGAPFAPSYTAMLGDLEVPPVTMPVGASQVPPAGHAAAWNGGAKDDAGLLGDGGEGAPTLERSTAGVLPAPPPAAAALARQPEPPTPQHALAPPPAGPPATDPAALPPTASHPTTLPAPPPVVPPAPQPAPMRTTITAPPTQNINPAPEGVPGAFAAPPGPASAWPQGAASAPGLDTLTAPPIQNMTAAPLLTPDPLVAPRALPPAPAVPLAAPAPVPSSPVRLSDVLTGPPLNNIGAGPGMTPAPLLGHTPLEAPGAAFAARPANTNLPAVFPPSSPALDTITGPPLHNMGAAPGMTPVPLSVLASLPPGPRPASVGVPPSVPSQSFDTLTAPPLNNMGAAPGMTPAPLPPHALGDTLLAGRPSSPALDTITAPPLNNMATAPAPLVPQPRARTEPATATPFGAHGNVITGPPLNNMEGAPVPPTVVAPASMDETQLGAPRVAPAHAQHGGVTIPPTSRAVPISRPVDGIPVDGVPVDGIPLDAPAPGLVASHHAAADDYFSVPAPSNALDLNATVAAGPSWGDLAADAPTLPRGVEAPVMPPSPGSPWATTLPPPGATPQAAPVGPFVVAALPGRPDGWRATAPQLWTALGGLAAGDAARVRVGVGAVAATPLAVVAARLALDHLVSPPVPLPPPKDVPLDLVGLKQAFSRLAVSKATGMLLLKQDNGHSTALYVTAGNLHHVHGAHLGMPLALHLCPAGVDSDAFTALVTRVLDAELDVCAAAVAQGLIPALDVAAGLAPWLRARLAAALAPARFLVSFCPGVAAPFQLPAATISMSTLV
jgi:serine/threonine protein kinase